MAESVAGPATAVEQHTPLPVERLFVSRFAGRSAVVTGAAQGMGRAICERLLEEGASGVVGFDLNGEALDRTAAQLGDQRFVPFAGDVSDSSVVRRSVEACIDRFDRLDLMVAHAGIAEPRPLLETDDDHWRRHLAVNVDGVFWCVREAARAMVARMLVLDGGQTLGIRGDLESAAAGAGEGRA